MKVVVTWRPATRPTEFDPLVGGSREAALFRGQKEAADSACSLVVVSATVLCKVLAGEDVEIDPQLNAGVKRQQLHIASYRRHPHDASLEVEYRRLGSKIDSVLMQACELFQSVDALVKAPGQRQSLRERAAAAERARQERIEAHRRERARRPAAPAPTAKREKREKLPPKPRCEKCGKRPAAYGTLCEPCARWTLSR